MSSLLIFFMTIILIILTMIAFNKIIFKKNNENIPNPRNENRISNQNTVNNQNMRNENNILKQSEEKNIDLRDENNILKQSQENNINITNENNILKQSQENNINITNEIALEEYLDLNNLQKEITNFHKKETKIIFFCEKLILNYYSKLIIFNEEYNLNEKTPLIITMSKTNPLKSDFTENIILKSDNGDTKNFIINICYHIDNYYQLLLDKIEDPLSLEIVFYSKENKFPESLKGNLVTIKDYNNSNLPNLKRFNILNISRNEFYDIYDKYSFNKLTEKNKSLINDSNALFVNFIDKKFDYKYEGKIFQKLEDEKPYDDFNEEELILLEMTKEFISKSLKNEKFSANSSLILLAYLSKIKDIKDETINNVVDKISHEYYFIKYYNSNIDNNLIELIEAGFFIEYLRLNAKVQKNAVKLFKEYIKRKKELLKNEEKFNNFEKLMILVSLHNLILKDYDVSLIRLCDLPITSPFVASEKIYLDIIKEINEKSCLYFYYLQINSSSGIDFVSSNTWYQIKYIPLIEIKAHLIYSRFRFFFTYNKFDKEPAFVDLQTLIKNYNVSEIPTGYDYENNLELEESINNSVKLLFYKLHENSHSKCYCKVKKLFSPRYLYNFDLKVLDCHYDTIMEYKKGKNQDNFKKLGEGVGEEGYAIEMFIYDDIAKTDNLLVSSVDLKNFYNSELYSGNNFDKLKELISGIPIENNKDNESIYNQDERKTVVQRLNNMEEYKKNMEKNNPIEYFKHCKGIGKY